MKQVTRLKYAGVTFYGDCNLQTSILNLTLNQQFKRWSKANLNHIMSVYMSYINTGPDTGYSYPTCFARPLFYNLQYKSCSLRNIILNVI